MSFSILFTSPASALPGPISTIRPTPPSLILLTTSTHLTGLVSCLTSESFTSAAPITGSAPALVTSGIFRLLNPSFSSSALSLSAAGAMSGECEGALTCRVSALFAPMPRAMAAAFSTAPACPDMTICSGLFMLAGTTTSPSEEALMQASLTASCPRPIIAHMLPLP